MKKELLVIRCLSCSLVLLLLLLPLVTGRISHAGQQERGQGVRIKVGNGQEILYDESHALVVGISDYTNGWPKLDGVKKDVPAVADLLKQLGFQVETLMNPTGDALDKALRTFINKYGLKERNRLLIYFSGHGHTEALSDGRDLGYIVPADAPSPERDLPNFNLRAISMDQMDTFARSIRAKHALFVFDSCFSGSIFDSGRKGESSVPPAIESKTAAPVRQFITSGTKTQTVPNESIFRAYFVRAFEQREGDLNGDGFITGEELGMYLAGRVASDSRDTQTPRFGKIKDVNLNLGDFVFTLPKPKPTPTPTPTPKPTPTLAQSQEIAVKKQEQPEANNPKPLPKQDLAGAVLEGNIGDVKALLAIGADVNVRGRYGDTPLIIAARTCSFTITKFLLENGANVNAKNDGGTTALLEIIDNKATSCNNRDRITQSLLDAKADVNASNNDGLTPLMLAVQMYWAWRNIVDLLLAKGADINAKNSYGTTTLMMCRSKDNAQALLAKGADVNAKNNNGRTALMVFAGEFNSSEIVQVLLDKGADVNVKDNRSWTALMLAEEVPNNDAIIQMLKKAGAK